MSARNHHVLLKRILAALSLLLCSAAGWAATPDSGATQRMDYSSFKIISERNIFNAGRSGRSAGTNREARRPSRVDTITLVGTMDSDKGLMAFFDGSSSEFRKALKPNASIAGYKVAAISHTSVKLANGTNKVELRVGMALRREDEGQWQVIARGEGGSSAGGTNSVAGVAAASRGAVTGSGSNASAAGGDASEVLKRLMERRAKEEQ